MTNEKAKVSMMERVIARMNNKVYADQQELIQAVLEVLCKTKDHDFKYHHSFTNFENNNSLLKAVGLERTAYGQIVRTKKNQEIRDFFEV
tara:strand:- start:95 stop:364 length:270 start_codon:yes stop_codon:yes gene_type:complete